MGRLWRILKIGRALLSNARSRHASERLNFHRDAELSFIAEQILFARSYLSISCNLFDVCSNCLDRNGNYICDAHFSDQEELWPLALASRGSTYCYIFFGNLGIYS